MLTVGQRGFLEYFSISNILTDTALIIIPAVIVWPLKMSMKTRLTIVCIFGTRALFVTPRFELILLGYTDRFSES